ncbi:MAG TPA: DUF296 domain-containing protein [Candidatus Polarisedimenticolia bacterium]|nr:DUF296 domain-containing protein [Candidatus Polarisedimenticolia bacterium]
MDHGFLTGQGGPPARLMAVRLHPGEEIVSSLKRLAREAPIPSAALCGIGAVDDVVLALFDPRARAYVETRLTGDLEVVSLSGSIGWAGEEPVVHLHGVVSRVDGTTAGGHLMKGVVSVTLEVMAWVGDRRLARRRDEATGLNLLDPAGG